MPKDSTDSDDSQNSNSSNDKSPSILTRTWRYFPFKKYDSFMTIALTDVALSSVHRTGTPIVWLYGVEQNTVSVGVNQKINEVVNKDQAKRLDILIVRRTSDGGAVYLDTAGEISWNIILPNELLPVNEDPLKFYADKICEALEALQIESYFKTPDDIFTTLGKLSVLSIKKERYATLIGGTMLYAVNTAMMQSVLTPENDPNKPKRIPERLRAVTSISSETEKSKEDTMRAISEALLNERTFKVDDWTSQETSDAKTLIDKYMSEEWLRIR